MSLVLVTGSTDGIGLETARQLLAAGHDVVAHARDDGRAADVRTALPGLRDVVVGDLTSLAQTEALAEAATAAGPFDAVVHNAGVGASDTRQVTPDGLERIFQVNVVAPYVLTALVPRPARLVYLASGAHTRGRVQLDDLQHERGQWDGSRAYADSKLYDVMLALAVARRWPDVLATAVDPGWIRTKMGGPHASGELEEGAPTQVWLATGDDDGARVTGRYLKSFQVLEPHPDSLDVDLQEALLERLAALTGITLPG